MGDRDYFKQRAATERAAAIQAKDAASCRAHMTLSKEYDFRAACEPVDAIEREAETYANVEELPDQPFA